MQPVDFFLLFKLYSIAAFQVFSFQSVRIPYFGFESDISLSISSQSAPKLMSRKNIKAKKLTKDGPRYCNYLIIVCYY